MKQRPGIHYISNFPHFAKQTMQNSFALSHNSYYLFALLGCLQRGFGKILIYIESEALKLKFINVFCIVAILPLNDLPCCIPQSGRLFQGASYNAEDYSAVHLTMRKIIPRCIPQCRRLFCGVSNNGE